MSPPYPRFEKLDEEKQDAILSAAMNEFVLHGYDGASLNQVISQANISKGSFYYYFEDKLDLLMTLIERKVNFRKLLDESKILESTSGEEFWACFERVLELGVEIIAEDPQFVKLGHVFAGLSPNVRQSERVTGFMAQSSAYLVEMLVRGQEIGVIRKDLPMPILVQLWFSVDQVFDHWGMEVIDAHGLESEEVQAFWATALDMFKRMFAP